LALVLLCIQRGSAEQALAVLNSLSHSSLAGILSDHPALLLEQQFAAAPSGSTSNGGGETVPSFSELASVLVDSRPAVLADVLAGLVTVSQFVTLQQILQVRTISFAVARYLGSLLLSYFWFSYELSAAESLV
jgi:hypothetical protein